MTRTASILFLLLTTTFCIEPYDFRIKDKQSTLVIESQISNVSYSDSKKYPSDGRYFSVKLSNTSDVSNIRNVPVTFATVALFDDLENFWMYTESPIGSGVYILFDEDFKAEMGRKYKLQIHLADGRIYTSAYEGISNYSAPEIGSVSFDEITKQVFEFSAGEKVITEKNGINVLIRLAELPSNGPVFYRWTFEPTWIFIAPFAFSSQPGYKCWVKNQYYLNDYALQEDFSGGYNKQLFFMETTRNERIYEKFSVLIVQSTMSKGYYSFWKEMYEQTQKGKIFDPPPFNLKSNFTSENGDLIVSGYFGVVEEQAVRWYFNKEDLSYNVANTLRADCSVPFQDPGPECFHCFAYPFGDADNIEPDWWEN